ncbi:MAG: hypothetical protein MI717_14200 [Spirochaetales bacterium]|nr:hypothetical protein [Spirochaetales bacterium]
MGFDSWTSLEGAQDFCVSVAGANDEVVAQMVAWGVVAGVRFRLHGPKNTIESELGMNLSHHSLVQIMDTSEDEEGVCLRAAKDCQEGRSQVLMKGQVSTAAFTRGILNKDSGLTPSGHLLSHLALFEKASNGDGVFLTDAAINIAPDVEAKKRILTNALDALQALGVQTPRVAFLAPMEKVTAKISSSIHAHQLSLAASQGEWGDVHGDGPMALDVALSEDAARMKGAQGEVAGQADLLLAPALDAGNMIYKALVTGAQWRNAGVLLGASVPVVLTSRSDHEEAKKASLGLALHLAKH